MLLQHVRASAKADPPISSTDAMAEAADDSDDGIILSVADMERAARRRLPEYVGQYYSYVCGDQARRHIIIIAVDPSCASVISIPLIHTITITHIKYVFVNHPRDGDQR